MTIFRAIQKSEVRALYASPKTKRMPKNVPYLVDNLWEWLRPSGYPSRRHAVYASPNQELALGSAHPNGTNRTHFAVGRVIPVGTVRAVQLKVTDAKRHPDVEALPDAIRQWLGQSWIDSPLTMKLPLGALFLPVVDSEDVERALNQIPGGDELRKVIVKTSSFWADATPLDVNMACLSNESGELFFEAPDGYRLVFESLTQQAPLL